MYRNQDGRSNAPRYANRNSVLHRAREHDGATETLSVREAPATAGNGIRGGLQTLRPHQWIKNVLVFVPLIAAHETGGAAWLAAAGTATAFCACASAGYVLNDLLDLPHDRRHPSRRLRALAGGRVRPRTMACVAVGLAPAGFALAFVVAPAAGLAALCYLVVAAAYTLLLKRVLFLDVMTLAALYSLRVAAGAAAVSVPVSPWLGAFSLLVFVALATVKRQRELYSSAATDGPAAAGRAYRAEDHPVLIALGAAAGFAAVVVLALYVQSPAVNARYDRPSLLWLICPLLVYWLGRLLLLANRGAVDDDPVAFALRDRASWITVAGIAAAFVAAL